MTEFLNSLRIAIEIVFVLVFVPTGLAVIYLIKARHEIKDSYWSFRDPWGWRHIVNELRRKEKDGTHE